MNDVEKSIVALGILDAVGRTYISAASMADELAETSKHLTGDVALKLLAVKLRNAVKAANDFHAMPEKNERPN